MAPGATEVLPPLVHIALNTGINYSPPTNASGQRAQSSSQWPVSIPERHRANAYAIFFVLIMVDWSLVFGERPILSSHRRFYSEQQQILEKFLESLQQIKDGVDENLSIQSALERDFPNRNRLQLEHVIIWETLMRSPRPMSVEEIGAALAERKALAFVGSRWNQLANLVGAEEIYFCIYRPREFRIQGLDIVETVFRGDDAAFERLESEIWSSYTWLKEICLGLKGVLFMVKIAATTSDTATKAQIGIHIQERIREVFGPINLRDFNKSMLLMSGEADHLHSVRGDASESPSPMASAQRAVSTQTPRSVQQVSATGPNSQGPGIAGPSNPRSPSSRTSTIAAPFGLTVERTRTLRLRAIPAIQNTTARPGGISAPASALYEPLDKSREEIRLLEILPPTDVDYTIRCRLKTVPVHRCRFIAISYVWGDLSMTENIVVNGERKPVATTLISCLYNIRTAISTNVDTQSEWASLPRLVWVDAVCVNQSDIEERNHQIQLMGQIYTGASVVVSWLGPHDEMLSTAFRIIRLISSTRRSMNAGPNDFEWMRSCPELWTKDRTGTTTWQNKAWEAVDKFLGLPNWRRVWILQEMVLATRLWLMSGLQTLDYSCLVDVSIPCAALRVGLVAKPDFLSNSLWTMLSGGALGWSHIIYIEQLRKNLKSPDPQERRHCFDLIWSTLKLQATDPRDKIFGLLGICNSDITPDYTKSVREVYVEFGKEYIRSQRNLKLLSHAGLGFHTENQFNLPSWVPDFQSLSSPSSSESNVTGFGAGRRITSTKALPMPFTDNQDYLHIFGHICDSVSAIHPDLKWGEEALFRFCISYLFDRPDSPDIPGILELIARKDGPLYVTGIPRLQALFQLFLQGSFAGPSLMDQSVAEFYNRSLCFVTLINSRKEWNHLLCDDERLEEYLGTLAQGTAFGGSPGRLPYAISIDFRSWVGKTGAGILTNLLGHCVFQTASGYLGFGPWGICQDDLVCVLQESSLPVVLRKVGSHYVHIGPCFVLGLMDGEVEDHIITEKEESKIQEFEIR
ncbi:hypothetical protein GP486_005667 [Trichoglossum hirsutum]|uniref:Heterokaryon incompatibility domain-containing protein n=1 Tax=Trichoglossum hirsutum TaxID=265104 RepID=A0A9P8L8S6_9PEZI|nr:hypothetical protein GP486_005667 [Trichoglossum hirsutum]